MTTEDKHTPLPWVLGTGRSVQYHYIHGPDGRVIAEVHKGNSMSDLARHDARFIVRACNSHDNLTRLLRKILSLGLPLPAGLYEEANTALGTPFMSIEQMAEQAAKDTAGAK